ncbi:hypothetical protein AOC36_02625 [Erysipelothrix larvae]|uniref:Aldose 1-epimerase n=1 Tax=Erysipelothrix larvae TaxID=1514105 RepID=A0A0X8GYS9_9FIRM|nr:hypothetical protein [Erysipelothrix larvae]AMC92917.1 hypothetical protein AOC36_02625 [Erysipelothrix larvae]
MHKYVISSQNLRVFAISKGATITQIQVLNQGVWMDTILDYADENTYLNTDPYYLNCVVGPHAGRIKDGVYQIGDQTIQLDRNVNGNHHHGGKDSFKDILFDVQVEDQTLTFTTYDEVHGIDVSIWVRVSDSDLTIAYKAIPKTPQVINMTHHLYFNLSDEKTIKYHTLKVDAPFVHAVDETGASTSEIIEVHNTPFDFSNKPYLKDRLEMTHPQFEFTRNIDHAFYTKNLPLVLESPRAHLGVEIRSTADYTVLYTANFFEGETSFVNRGPSQRAEAIAIESQDCPNGVNIEGTKDQIYNQARPYTQTTTYHFYSL